MPACSMQSFRKLSSVPHLRTMSAPASAGGLLENISCPDGRMQEPQRTKASTQGCCWTNTTTPAFGRCGCAPGRQGSSNPRRGMESWGHKTATAPQLDVRIANCWSSTKLRVSDGFYWSPQLLEQPAAAVPAQLGALLLARAPPPDALLIHTAMNVVTAGDDDRYTAVHMRVCFVYDGFRRFSGEHACYSHEVQHSNSRRLRASPQQCAGESRSPCTLKDT